MDIISKNSVDVIDNIKKATGNSPDIIIRTTTFKEKYIHVIFNEPLCDRPTINKFILEYFEENEDKKKEKDILKYLKSKIPAHKISKILKFDEMIYNLLSGFTIIVIDGYDEVLSVEARKKLDSGVMPAQAEMVIKGPKDAFTEDYETNIGLIRKRVKSDKLWLKEHIVGTRSKTKVGIMYIQDIADKDLVNQISEKIKNINIDAILDSNYVMETIAGNKKNVFPQYTSTERPDLVTINLLEGKVAIVVENTQYVVILPLVFIEFFHTSEDYYYKSINANYTRFIRLLAFIITILTPAIYIAITTHNHEAIPDKLLISFSAQRSGVPFPTIIEALLMLVSFEILKETDLRTPSTLGSAISIVGALILGEAAVQANIVSQIMVIVIAITTISGLILPSTELGYGIRWWRLFFIISAAMLGLIGVLITGLLFIINLSSMNSFGIPYLSPTAPLNISNQNDGIFITNKRKYFRRNNITAKKNIKRTKKGD